VKARQSVVQYCTSISSHWQITDEPICRCDWHRDGGKEFCSIQWFLLGSTFPKGLEMGMDQDLWGFHVFWGMNWIKIHKFQLSYSKCVREFSRGFHWWQEKWPWNRTWRCWRDLGKSCTSWKFIESGNEKYFNVNHVQFIFMILLDDLPVDCSWFILPSLLAGGVYTLKRHACKMW